MKFGPERRVRKRPEFLAIQSHGKRASTAHFVWIVSRSTDASAPARLGITASKRVGNSVRRSRIKRIVREAFRAENGMLPAGFDLVVICRKDDSSLTSQDVRSEWNQAKRRFNKWIAG